MATLLWLALALLCLVTAQIDPASYQPLCDKTFADANATGIYTISPNIFVPTEPDFASNDVSWAYTVHQNESLVSGTIWYNTGGANYTDDFEIGYDVCGFRIGDPGHLTARATYEGQNDTGNCIATLSEECVNAMSELGRQTASMLVANPSPGPGGNLTGGALPGVCSQIGEALERNLPTECRRFFDEDLRIDAFPMTDYNRTSANEGCCSNLQLDACPINSTSAEPQSNIAGRGDWDAWWSVQQTFAPANISRYDSFNQAVWTYMTIFLPVANRERTSTIETQAFMTCLHVDHFNPGSRVTPPKSSPTAESSEDSLSGGAIAGIVIGTVLGAALIALGIWFFWRRRTRAPSRQIHEATAASELSGDSEKSPISEMDPNSERSPTSEMNADLEHQKVEMSTGEVHVEKDGDPVHVELEGSQPQPVELSTHGSVKH